MDQENPNDPFGSGSGLNSGTTGNIGTGGTSTGAGYASGGTGTGMGSGGGMTTGSGGTTNTGPTSNSEIGGTGAGASTEAQYCTHCGQAIGGGGDNTGLEQFLGRLGISGDMFSNLKGSFANVDIDEYLNTAREYLKGGTSKVKTYTQENPAKVAAGVAALALGAGLIYAAVNRGKGEVEVEVETDTTVRRDDGGISSGG